MDTKTKQLLANADHDLADVETSLRRALLSLRESGARPQMSERLNEIRQEVCQMMPTEGDLES